MILSDGLQNALPAFFGGRIDNAMRGFYQTPATLDLCIGKYFPARVRQFVIHMLAYYRPGTNYP